MTHDWQQSGRKRVCASCGLAQYAGQARTNSGLLIPAWQPSRVPQCEPVRVCEEVAA